MKPWRDVVVGSAAAVVGHCEGKQRMDPEEAGFSMQDAVFSSK